MQRLRRHAPVRAACFAFVLGFFWHCAAEKTAVQPALPPPPVEGEKVEDSIPDVIKIAIRFVQYEGRAELLLLDKAYVKSQDHIVYLIGFPRKRLQTHGGREALVRVYKINGRAEWEEY
jgi:hypothetical protein